MPRIRSTLESVRAKVSSLEDHRAALLLWPIAILTMLYAFRHTYVDGPGGDFAPVWLGLKAFVHREPPYREAFFVYPPSALILLAPLGFLNFARARLIFHLIDTAAIVWAVSWLLRHFRVRWFSPVAPAVLFAVFISEPVVSTLGLGNVNGLVLLAEVGAFALLARDRPVAAGVAFGLGLAVKPVLAPLLLILLIQRRMRAFFAAVLVPILLSAIAAPLTRDVGMFVRDAVPFLLRGNAESNYLINTSVRGAVRILDLPTALGAPLRAAVLVFGIASLFGRWRVGGEDRIFLVEASGIVLATTFLVNSFSWAYYALFLLPVFVSLADGDSRTKGWRLFLAGAAAYLVASPDLLPRLASIRVAAGLVVLLLALQRMGEVRLRPLRAI